MSRFSKVRIVGLFLLTFFCSLLPAQEVKVIIDADSLRVRVGSPVELRLSASAPVGSRIALPEIQSNNKIWEVIQTDSLIEKETPEEIHVFRKYTITFWDTGTIKLPSFPVTSALSGSPVSDTFFSHPLTFSVSYVKTDTAQAPKPIIEPLETEVMWQEYWLWYIIGILGIMILSILFYFYRKKKANAILPQTIPPKPVHERAFIRLKELEASGKLERGEYKAYYSRLTDILRAYIELTSNVKATDLTSEDILRVYKPATSSQIEKLRNMLEVADNVKFAKYEPDTQTGIALMQSAKNWIAFEAGV